MSRSNYDKPFYVDVGTSVVAIRCASNHDVLVRYDRVLHPQILNFAKGVCDRMNSEFEAALKRERLLSKPPENDNSAPVVYTGDNKPRNCDRFKTLAEALLASGETTAEAPGLSGMGNAQLARFCKWLFALAEADHA